VIGPWKNEQYRNNALFRLCVLQRVVIATALKRIGAKKSRRTQQCFGCSDKKLAEHLESLFLTGMNWDNVGDWEIDHNIPISLGKTEQEVFVLSHWSNLQPLWKEDNRRKNATLPKALLQIRLPLSGDDRSIRRQQRRLLGGSPRGEGR
jgi:hypothetical protein